MKKRISFLISHEINNKKKPRKFPSGVSNILGLVINRIQLLADNMHQHQPGNQQEQAN